MSLNKPKLLPARVPWAVSSVPYLHAQTTKDGKPTSATFIGYFKLRDVVSADSVSNALEYVDDPGEFHPVNDDGRSAYRHVRINFKNGQYLRISPAVSEHDVIGYGNYDWSMVPGESQEGEDLQDNLKRTERYWLETGESPDPAVYEVEGSPWLEQLGAKARGLHHYIVVGHDDAVEVIAQAWSWEIGSPA